MASDFVDAECILLPSNTHIDRMLEIDIEHGEFEHEMVSIRIPETLQTSDKYQSGMAISLVYGRRPNDVASFIGYISHTEPVYDTDSTPTVWRSIWIHCIGATYIFKDGGFRSASNRTMSAVALELAAGQRFDTHNVEDSERVWQSVTQNGRTAWTFLVYMAKKSGFTMYGRGMSLFFHRRATGLAQGRYPVKTLKSRFSGGNLLNWKSSQGQTSPTGGELANRTLHGIDPRSGKQFTLQNVNDQNKPLLGTVRYTPMFNTGVLEPVHSPGEAMQSLSAIEGDNELVSHADAEVLGDAGFRIGVAVNVVGTNPVDDGLWYVKRVRHRFRGPWEFRTYLELGRDAVTGNRIPRATSLEFSPTPNATVLNGQWVLA